MKSRIKQAILGTLEKQQGILFAEPAIVYRIQYSGRNIIAKNRKFEKEYVDSRGYVPVEWWIMSLTSADNDKKKENEGLSYIFLETENGNEKVLLKDAIRVAEKELLGKYANQWPLTKILDIGGETVQTSFGAKEVPPIPCHVHSGEIKNGKAIGPGKLEAYFFPPVNVMPYNANFGKVITRLGLKPSIKKEDFIKALKGFGKDDSIYELCNIYEIKAYEGWTIKPGVIHAPGPWVTFEIQRPQDDFNLASWQLGRRLVGNNLKEKKRNLQLRGLKNEEAFLKEVVAWSLNLDQKFEQKWKRVSKIIESGAWGRRLQIFFDEFYGESFEINPGKSFTRKADERSFAGIVWSGKGILNNNRIEAQDNNRKEFLVTPNTIVNIKNTEKIPLLIYTVFPIKVSRG